MGITELSPQDLIKFIREKLPLLGYDFLFISLCREADFPRYFYELQSSWSSLHDLTGENILFLFYDSEKSIINRSNFSWEGKNGFFYNCGEVTYCPSLRLMNTISYDDRYDKFFYAKSGKSSRQNARLFEIEKTNSFTESVTLGVSKLSRMLSIPEMDIPCLYIESLKFGASITIPIQKIYQKNENVYSFVKTLKINYLDPLKSRYEQTYKIKPTNDKEKIDEIVSDCKLKFQEIRDDIVKDEHHNQNEMNFKVGLTFAGENRAFVEVVANELLKTLGNNTVFYDNYYKSILARPNLDTYLQNIYHNSCDYLAIFLCQNYSKKEWCGLEWRAIRDLLKKKKDDKIIFIKLEDFNVDGIFSIDGYLDGVNEKPEDIAKYIYQRINGR